MPIRFKKLTALLFFLVLIGFNISNAFVVGRDDRVDIEMAEQKIVALSQSVGALVSKSNLAEGPKGFMTFRTSTLKSRLEQVWRRPVCGGERFIDQPTLSDCAGVLIGANHFLTARHCVFDENECQNKLIVFDYVQKRGEVVQIKKESVFSCARLIDGSSGYALGNDWVILQLDRPPAGRKKVSFANPDRREKNAFVIGTPSGLPLKFMPGTVLDQGERTINGFFDISVYASGSPLFNLQGELMGLLTNQNQADFVLSERNCIKTNHVSSTKESLVIFQNAKTILSK